MVGLNSRVSLRTSKVQAFALPVSASLCPPVLCSLDLDFPFPQGEHCWTRKVGQKVVSIPVVPLFMGITHEGLCVPLVFAFIHLPDHLNLQPLPGSFFQPRSSSPFLRGFFFPRAMTVCVQEHNM